MLYPPPTLKMLSAEFLIHCPVYRYYGNRFPLHGEEMLSVQNIPGTDRKRQAFAERSDRLAAANFSRKTERKKPGFQPARANILSAPDAVLRPLMAKGVEDTIMYTYNLAIGHNEVGDSPEAFGITPEYFHEEMRYRQLTGRSRATLIPRHDTKRGEDVRARLNVLTDLGENWLAMAQQWLQMSESLENAQCARRERCLSHFPDGRWHTPDAGNRGRNLPCPARGIFTQSASRGQNAFRLVVAR